MDLWKSTQVLWRLYGTHTDLSEARYSLQSMQRYIEGLSIQILQVNPNTEGKAELEQLGLIGRLTVVPAETRSGLREGGELAQSPLAKGGSKASTHKPGIWCVKKCYRQAKELANLANHNRTNVANVDNAENVESVGDI